MVEGARHSPLRLSLMPERSLRRLRNVEFGAPSTTLRSQAQVPKPTLRVGVLYVKYGGRRPPMPLPAIAVADEAVRLGPGGLDGLEPA